MKEVKNYFGILFLLVGILIFSSFVSAGIGIKYEQESALVGEGEKACLTYGVYNPWDDETYATIGLSDSLLEILSMQEAETKLLPAQTSSDEAIPIEFCFKVPNNIYYKDCSVGSFICKQECTEEMKVYEGEVFVSTVPDPKAIEGTGGSATKYSISAPLRVRVKCVPHARDYTLVYVLLALISAAVIAFILIRRYRKPKAERDKEKLKKLKAEIAKESKGKRKKK